MNTIFSDIPIPNKVADHKIIGNVLLGADVLALFQIGQQYSGLCVVVTPDVRSALRLSQNLQELCKQSSAPFPVFYFPDWETLAYDHFSPHQDIISQRLSTLFQLQQVQSGMVILSIGTLMQRLCPPSYLRHNVLLIEQGQRINPNLFKIQLQEAGYRAVDQVLAHGEFAMRGALLDLFPMGSEHPFRLDFFDDEIESILTFDVDTQRTEKKIKSIELLPAHEFPTDEKAIESFRMRFREKFPEIRRDPEHIYQQVSKGIFISGIEYWQPLFFEKMANLFSYVPENTLFIDFAGNQQQGELFYQDAQQRYESRCVDPMRPLLTPSELWLRINEVNQLLKLYPRLTLTSEKLDKTIRQYHLPIQPLPEVSFQGQLKEPSQQLRQFLEHFQGDVVFLVETEGRRETLLELLSPLKLLPKSIQSIEEMGEYPISLFISSLDNGFILEGEKKTAFISESNLLGEKIRQRRFHKRKNLNPDTLIRNLAELKIGQPVVHLEHGVGRYQGLTAIENHGVTTEYAMLSYANNAKLYVPVATLHLISRYEGGSEENAPLHKLGSDAWHKARQKATEKIRDVAAELLDIYAQREATAGFAFQYHKENFQQFSAGFPFEETLDQEMAINAVISDMCLPKAMDRLVCGDVGFGKTEVAMRAAFLAIDNNKQVAVLVPTTLLAQQHFDNFKDRFANLPVNVEVLSRFKTAKEQKNILQQLHEGKVDILIGTHKLLQSDVKFNDLGLLIIDEEHRFGVRQKEQIKQLRANVDILTLTATPIPRTLNMAMNGIRDLSIISTPPAKRLTIRTFVRQKNDELIKEAILREILRGGQVYYLHNDVASIENCAENLAQLVPEARIIVGHGQMRERELERVMSDFYHQRFNVLVCSTIIETGIDVPTANTIIIERADRFGLAQLHQLRGRVGRSHQQAYAYLLTPHPKIITKEAVKRLEALESLDNLGAGFVLASHDLEIRGAGELLGEEQSGQIETLGFSLYMNLLEVAVKALKEGKEPTLDTLMAQQAEIDLHVPTLIPENYMGDVNMRLSFYKRIAGTTTKEEINELKVELIDRFGLLPQATKNLMLINEIRLYLDTLFVAKLEAGNQGGSVEFLPNTKLDPTILINLIQQEPYTYRFDGPNKFRFELDLSEEKVRLEFVKNLVKILSTANH